MIEFDCLITNGFPIYDKSFTGRHEKGWKVVATLPANLIHPHACDTDMATIFTRYISYPKNEYRLKEEIEATIVKDEYSGNYGWVTEYYVAINDSTTFEDIIKKYEDKKVKIAIHQLLEDDNNEQNG